jgi:hypothetical protein
LDATSESIEEVAPPFWKEAETKPDRHFGTLK